LPETQGYIAKRTAEGLSKKDTIRCLARETYHALVKDLKGLDNL
jgi:hypothetical protein